MWLLAHIAAFTLQGALFLICDIWLLWHYLHWWADRLNTTGDGYATGFYLNASQHEAIFLHFILIGPQHPLQPEARSYGEPTSQPRCSEDRADTCWDESPHSKITLTTGWCMMLHKLSISSQESTQRLSGAALNPTAPHYCPCLLLPLLNLCSLCSYAVMLAGPWQHEPYFGVHYPGSMCSCLLSLCCLKSKCPLPQILAQNDLRLSVFYAFCLHLT